MPWRWALLISVGFLSVAITAALWSGALPLESVLLRVVAIDQNLTSGQMQFDLNQLRRAVELYVIVFSLFASFIPWLFVISGQTWSSVSERLFPIAMVLSCSSALFLLFWRLGYEGPWYPIEALMKHPGTVPIFGHRLLLVWLADLCQKLVPSLSYLQCYVLSQMLPIVSAVFMVGRWSELFIGRSLRWTGQVLLVAIMGPTLTYFTFYDFSIVFFYALSLYLLYRRHYIWFALAISVATLNHENALILIVIAGLETFRRSFRIGAAVTFGSLLLHLAVRFVMERAFPSGRIVDWHVWTNLVFPLIRPRLVIVGALALVFWWIVAALCWPAVEPFLRRAAVVFPFLLATDFVYGQINEARVFDASIPVLIAFILSFAKSKLIDANPAAATT